ncbi:HdeD family acid-resistance protein [Bartonella sp. HY038]|uniref:HdeD family acid-resistance protein n=1 Tax=Bartonella sp. HY038 TaxID=2759660 RepID=UPI001FEF032D|nr:HdeD family acid-resistance protein [Bartonella sp. HY038]
MSSFNSRNNMPPLPNIGIKWGWFLALGIALLVIGFIAGVYTLAASVVAAFYIGALMIFGGVAQIFQAFSVKGWGQFLLWLIAGIIYLLAGFVCFYNPLEAVVVLTFVLGFFLILSGALRIVIGFQNNGITGSGWIILAGVLSVLLGLMILIGWPANSFYIIGIFIAIDLIFQGWGCIAFALGLKAIQK